MSNGPARGGRWRTPVARLLTVVGVLLLVVSIAANFVDRQALGKSDFQETAKQLIADPAIQRQVAASLTDALFANVDVKARLQASLPANQKGLAGPIAGAMRPLAQRLSLELLQRPRVQDAWVAALTVAQQEVVRLLDDRAKYINTEGGVVAVDLRPVLQQLAEQLPLVPNLSQSLPKNAGVITLFKAEELKTAQRATRGLRLVAEWIWVLVLIAWVAAVYLARDRRKETRAIAVGLVVVGILVLLVRRLAGDYVSDQLSDTPSQADAIKSTWDIISRLLVDAAWAAIAVGVVALVGIWVAGPSKWGTGARRVLAPYLRRPWLTYGVAAFLFALLVLWGPISYVQRPLTLLAFAIIAALGVETLRRMAARDFPDATSTGIVIPSFGSTRQAPTQADELERLAGLKAQGLLTDAEFAAAKAQALGTVDSEQPGP
jgi:hypothetical protein